MDFDHSNPIFGNRKGRYLVTDSPRNGLRHRERPQAFGGEDAGGAGGSGRLSAEHVVDAEAGIYRRVIAGVVGADESAGEPMRADLVGNLAAQIVVGTNAGLGGEHGTAQSCLKGLIDR